MFEVSGSQPRFRFVRYVEDVPNAEEKPFERTESILQRVSITDYLIRRLGRNVELLCIVTYVNR